MVINEHQCKSIEINRNQWKTMVSNGEQWHPMENPEKSTEIDRNQ